MSDTTAIESCGQLNTPVSLIICLAPAGHDGEHIGMFGNSGLTVTVHWGTLEQMTDEMSGLQGRGLR